ncbi:MAG: CoA-binding protein [Actinobacteria bacterium]|nr:MAG: CoA-binding protein [Actinomycetota bacterium]RIK07584.1 MAG: pimeloyl-CoA synthetase [Acidobacteriota bacterium]
MEYLTRVSGKVPTVTSCPDSDVTGRPVALRDLDLGSFFEPGTVVVIGASDTARRPNTAMWRKIRQWAEGHGATVYPVNPNRDTIDGQPCFSELAEVPGEIDLAVILVNDAVNALRQAIDRKARFAVIFAAGFAEVGDEGQQRQHEIEELLAGAATHLLGPNTNLNAFETFRQDLPGPSIALITQSGHQGRPVFQAQDLGIAISHWAPTGNEADLEFADFARFFADQPDVGVIAAYIEGFKDGRTLMLAADHAAQRGVPLVVVKVGRTTEGRSMAASHTGHLAGSDEICSAVFRQFGVTRVDGLDDLTDTAAMLARTRPPRGDGVCIYAISGGTGAHMADMAAAAGLRLPELTKKTQGLLHEWIPTYLRVSNPVDNGGPPSADERGRKILDAIIADPNVDLVICPITGALASISAPLARDLVAAAETTDKPICVIWGSPVTEGERAWETLVNSQLPLFRTFDNCVEAVRAYFDYHEFVGNYRSPFAMPVLEASPAAEQVRPLISTADRLSEHTSKQVLAAYGIPVTEDILVSSAAEASRAAAKLGFPVVMKICSPDLLHKSDAGLVAVGVTSAAEAKRTFGELSDRAARADEAARVEGVLVCEMVSGGVEAVVGVSNDDFFGPTVMFGLGGVFVEVLRDISFRVPPFDRREAHRMIEEIRGLPLLRGARGRPTADIDALVDVLMRVQTLAVDHASTVAEVDINPLLVSERGAVALDALVVPSGQQSEPAWDLR